MRISDWSSTCALPICLGHAPEPMGFKRQKQRLSEHAHVTSDAHGLVHRGHEEQCDMRRAEKLEILHDSEVALFSGLASDSRRIVIGCPLILPADRTTLVSGKHVSDRLDIGGLG